MHEIYKIKFDVRAMIDYLGGVSGAVALLNDAGITMKARTIQKQIERGNISADMVASILYATKKAGFAFDPYDFLERKDND